MDISSINCHENKAYVLQFLNKGKMFQTCVFFSTPRLICSRVYYSLSASELIGPPALTRPGLGYDVSPTSSSRRPCLVTIQFSGFLKTKPKE